MNEDKGKGSLSMVGSVVTHLTVAWYRAISPTRKGTDTVGQGSWQSGSPEAAGGMDSRCQDRMKMEVKVGQEKNIEPSIPRRVFMARPRGCNH